MKIESNISGSVDSAMRAAPWVCGLTFSAGLAAFSLQSPSAGWLGWVMLIPLLLAIRNLAPLHALGAGSIWGIGLFAFSALLDVTSFSIGAAALVRLAVVPAAFAWLGSILTRRKGFSPLILGLGWVGVELALQPLGFKNGLLAGLLDHSLVVRTLGYLAGSLVVAFLIVYVNASILSMLVGASVVPGGSRRAPRSSSATVSWSIPDLPAYVATFLGIRNARAPPAR